MRIRHQNFFRADKVVPVDVLPVFGTYYYTAIYPGAFLQEPYISLSIPTIKVLVYLKI